MPWDNELCATFYVGHPAVPGPHGRLLTQLDLIGMTDVHVQCATDIAHGPPPHDAEVSGRWSDMDVEVRDRALDLFRAVTLVFPAPAFWPGVTRAFGLACERLRPAAAFVTDLAAPDVEQIVADREEWLVQANPVPLLHDGFALLHLSAAWFPGLEGFLRGLPYRRIPLAGGPLLIGVETEGC